MLRIRRGPDQDVGDMVQFRDENNKLKGGIDVNFRYFGDSSRMTGILKAMNVVLDDDAAAHDNYLAIKAVLDAAAANPDIDTIKLPNAKLYCDQLKLTGAHAGLTIEGGGKTVMVNRAHPDGLGVFFADPGVIGYYDRVFGYQPGNANVTEVKITSEPITELVNYEEGQLIYLFPQYYQQSIALSRDCQMNKIVAPEGHDLAIENCRVVKTSDVWSFDGADIRFSHVQFDVADNGAISFGANCSACVLENLRLPATNSVSFDSSSTGYYVNVSAEQSPPSGWRVSARLLQMLERTASSAPEADNGVVFVRDSSGKSQLCARFHTGDVQVIATEP